MQIDHLYGQRVSAVFTSPAEGLWALQFESGNVLTNLSPDFPLAPPVENALLQRAVFTTELTTMYFDNAVAVVLNPTDYSITTPEDSTYFPQRPAEEE